MNLGKILATTHVLTLGGRAALAWGPATKVCGPMGLDESHSYLQGRANTMTLANNEISRFISVYTTC